MEISCSVIYHSSVIDPQLGADALLAGGGRRDARIAAVLPAALGFGAVGDQAGLADRASPDRPDRDDLVRMRAAGVQRQMRQRGQRLGACGDQGGISVLGGLHEGTSVLEIFGGGVPLLPSGVLRRLRE